MTCLLAVYLRFQPVLSADIYQPALDNGIKFFNAKHLVQRFKKGFCSFLGEREGCAHLEQGRIRTQQFQGFSGVSIAYAVSGNALSALAAAYSIQPAFTEHF